MITDLSADLFVFVDGCLFFGFCFFSVAVGIPTTNTL